MDQMEITNRFKGQSRLPKFAIPNHYDLHLKLHLWACTFSGSLGINLSIVEVTKFIVLNSLELTIPSVLFIDSNAQRFFPCDFILIGDVEIVVLVFDEELSLGDGVLKIEFSGVLMST